MLYTVKATIDDMMDGESKPYKQFFGIWKNILRPAASSDLWKLWWNKFISKGKLSTSLGYTRPRVRFLKNH